MACWHSWRERRTFVDCAVAVELVRFGAGWAYLTTTFTGIHTLDELEHSSQQLSSDARRELV